MKNYSKKKIIYDLNKVSNNQFQIIMSLLNIKLINNKNTNDYLHFHLYSFVVMFY